MTDVNNQTTKRDKLRRAIMTLAESKEPELQTRERPNSHYHTKLELPIVYSNLVTIEDMTVENSNYFLTSNGFITNNIYFEKSGEKFFEMSNCVFRIFPKTYNLNKYKVLDEVIKKGDETEETDINAFEKGTEAEVNFKFESEIFNNLDIIESKLGEPVKYGDIIMLMHENSHKMLKFNYEQKKLILSNHDSEYTLFVVEPYCKILLNDDQILKSGQPIKLRVASFNFANENLYLALHFPYSQKSVKVFSRQDGKQIDRSDLRKLKEATKTQNMFDRRKKMSKFEEFQTEENHQDANFDRSSKKYKTEPNIIIEANANVSWRFNLYSTFTVDEKQLMYGEYIQLCHCGLNGVFTIANLKSVKPHRRMQSLPFRSNPDDSDISINPVPEEIDDNFNHCINLESTKSEVDVEFGVNPQTQAIDVNSVWIMENIFTNMKQSSFIRYFSEESMDRYRISFRLKNFKTNKYLTIKKSDNILSTEQKYEFVLIDGPEDLNSENYILSSKYQYSIFAFQPMTELTSFAASKVAKNEFLLVYHVKTGTYLKIKQKGDSNLCELSLTPFPEEQETFKVLGIEHDITWQLKFLNNLFYLFKSVINHIHDCISTSTSPIRINSIKYSSFLSRSSEKFRIHFGQTESLHSKPVCEQNRH